MQRSADQRIHARLQRAKRCAADPGPMVCVAILRVAALRRSAKALHRARDT
jgi:hypothetical protein